MTVLAIALPIAAFVVSAGLTRLVRSWAVKAGFCARPTEERYHSRVIALGGGAAIFWTVAIFVLGGAAAVKLFSSGDIAWLDQSVRIHIEGFLAKVPYLLIVVGCAFWLHLLGLWDDIKGLGPYVKLAAQLVIAVVAAACADVRVEMFIENRLITIVLSALWLVLIINAFNFLDNMDGCSAGIAIIATGVLLTAAFGSGQVFVAAMGLVFAGALAGFLVFNFPPAKIFMGDAGSLVVGFFVGLLTLRTTYYHQSQNGAFYAVLMPLVVMAVPLYDFLGVVYLRLRQGKSPFVGDTQHFSHRLARRGLSDRQVVLTLYLATLCTGLGAVLLRQVNWAGAVIVFAQTLMTLAVVAMIESGGPARQ